VVQVLITVDTEVWPESPGWPHKPLRFDNKCERELEAYFWGGGAARPCGLPFQLATLEEHGLKATYYVDPLFSFALGLPPLKRVVDAVTQKHQEVALHLHPEWLTDPRCVGLPRFAGPLLRQYSEQDQAILVRASLERLAEAGVRDVSAFRAGSWGADSGTLRALARNNLRFDSSFNYCFDASFPELEDRGAYVQPTRLDGMWEIPVTSFVDRPPRGRRPLHVCACSMVEFRTVLEHAEAAGWATVVIVLHSFEFVRVDRLGGGREPGPRRLVVSRFEGICRYLAQHRDRFNTAHFADLDPDSWDRPLTTEAPRSHLGRTAARHIAQLLSRVY
jgi:hypothetical protein